MTHASRSLLSPPPASPNHHAPDGMARNRPQRMPEAGVLVGRRGGCVRATPYRARTLPPPPSPPIRISPVPHCHNSPPATAVDAGTASRRPGRAPLRQWIVLAPAQTAAARCRPPHLCSPLPTLPALTSESASEPWTRTLGAATTRPASPAGPPLSRLPAAAPTATTGRPRRQRWLRQRRQRHRQQSWWRRRAAGARARCRRRRGGHPGGLPRRAACRHGGGRRPDPGPTAAAKA